MTLFNGLVKVKGKSSIGGIPYTAHGAQIAAPLYLILFIFFMLILG